MPKKYLNLILISIAFIVWVVIFYQLVLSDNEDEDYLNLHNLNHAQSVKGKKKNDIEKYLSKVAIDPFITPFNYSVPKPKTEISNKSIKPKNIPKIQLLGILSDKEGPMAIVGFPDNSIQFVREKQSIEKFTILTITENTVKYKYENIKQSVELN